MLNGPVRFGASEKKVSEGKTERRETAIAAFAESLAAPVTV